ncbi:GNAT family N-acetyltransferase [Oceanimonas baumannii]|uniref:GNAT family N-acetyltransferase n=1 Tax=Oceanimonas baumannii TaxID=129578 RepID=A0A235CPJ0_9GAMM|nr:N-acetyltransferase [Oceanimonas baumannii]OYD26294.1 GNAT family N-acetyltransferase [Oceanimonas baumannii]TDW62048.1 ribosomal protein S18 acetylase RimI-like enzyme [Oceanimonas baumannii]
MNIRAASKADLAGVYQLECDTFGSHGYPDFFLRQAWDLWPGSMLMAEDDTGLRGYVLAGRGEVADESWILSLAVAPAARGQGLGRKLLQAAVNELERQGCRHIKLTVLPDNPALHLYRSLGFTEVSREEDYFGPGEPRLVMVKS